MTVPVRAALSGMPTRAQVRVIVLVAEGLTDRQIAARLGVAESTVVSHVEQARWRLDARNRAHLAAIAIRRGII